MFTIKRTMQLLASTLLTIAVGSSQALGVSDIQLKSYLNQKLDAEIQLSSVTSAELNSLTVTINQSDGEGRHRQQLDYQLLQAGAENILKITSSEVIKEPILSFQLEINWQTGHLVREYTLLIDPPGK